MASAQTPGSSNNDGRWFARCRQLLECLPAAPLSENALHEEWRSARQSSAPREAYAAIVDRHYWKARELSGERARGALDPENLAEHPQFVASLAQGLPQWCLASGSPQGARRGGAAAAGGEEEPRPRGRPEEAAPQAETPPRATLWLGDIPQDLADVKSVNKVLYDSKPKDMPSPFIKKVVKQGYRAQGPAEDAVAPAVPSPEGGETRRREPPPWLGYAFVEFRDTEEAAEALACFDGLKVDGWTVRAQWAEERHQARTTQFRKVGPRLLAGEDPPLGEQLFPGSWHREELATALARHAREARASIGVEAEAWMLAEAIKAYYRKFPRKQHYVSGTPLPERLLTDLRRELRHARWPPAPHRVGMQAQHYLVLHVGKPNEGYDSLMRVLSEAISWVDPDFGCNRIAVTKDFQGSPHIDASDVTYQYAISIGDFDVGGQLCLEGDCPSEVWVVDTHDRVAKIDGRFVHWVRGHGGGERYSLIFFSTNPACSTDKQRPFHADLVPRAVAGAPALSEDPR